MKMYWFNERTQQFEYIDTPSDFSDYLPQIPAAINLYKLYIEHEKLEPIRAYLKVMEMIVKDK